MNDLQELSTFSHEINNSLTLIYGQIQCIEKTYDTLTGNDHWNRMKDDFSSLFDFIHQFLAPAEESSAAIEPLDLISVISEIRSSWSYYLHKEQHVLNLLTNHIYLFLFYFLCNVIYYVYGARSKLFQLFHNLISNAVKAIQQKKETCRSPHITHITVHLSKEQGHIVLNLSDTGIGMTTEQQSRAFYRGVSFHPGGNGIGLSVVQNIARDLHIKIHIDSAPNQGTTFTLIFPAYEQQLSCPTRTEALTK